MPIRIGQNQLANESSEVPGRTAWRVWMDSRPQRLRGLSRALHQVRMGGHFDSKPILDNQYVTTIRPPESGLVGKSVGKLPPKFTGFPRCFRCLALAAKTQQFRFVSQPYPSLRVRRRVKKLLVFLFRSSSSISQRVNSPFVLPHLSVSPYQTVEASQNFTIATTQIKSLDKAL